MDLNDAWQENKRFVVVVASGALVFVIGLMLIDHYFAQELKGHQNSLASTRRKLSTEKMYDAEALRELQRENAELLSATSTLEKAVAFAPRPAFSYDPQKGASTNQYFQTVATVRDELLTLAGRANMRLPADLGLPALSPTRDPEIARYLEGLDVCDRAVRMALAAGVDRIEKIEIKLDPKLNSRDGVGAIERTRVEMQLAGRPGPLVQLLLLAQAPKDGGPILLEKSSMASARTKTDEALLEVTFIAARLHETQPAGTP